MSRLVSIDSGRGQKGVGLIVTREVDILAACQTTCYPVCQARLRRKHRTFKKETIEEEEERNADNVSEEREEERR